MDPPEGSPQTPSWVSQAPYLQEGRAPPVPLPLQDGGRGPQGWSHLLPACPAPPTHPHPRSALGWTSGRPLLTFVRALLSPVPYSIQQAPVHPSGPLP